MFQLTLREVELARLVAKGHSNKEISESLAISQQTVKNHIRSIYKKLGIANRTQLTLYVSIELDNTRSAAAPAQ
jgi:DNA-binding NarL/FixJ family response regulator